MKKTNGKKILSLVFATVLTLSLSSCGNSNTGQVKTVSTGADGKVDWSKQPLLKVDEFAENANCEGTVVGWWGKILKDKFNMEINIIAPNIAGGGKQLYTTRTAAGNLGDLLELSKQDMKDCIGSNLVYNMTDLVKNQPNINKYVTSIKLLNTYLGDVNKVYACSANTSLSSPSSPSLDGTNLSNAGYFRWDYYKELGYPVMNNSTDLLNVLKQMQTAHPKSPSGKKTYAVSIFKDWDSTHMKVASMFTNLYGFQDVDNGFIAPNYDYTNNQDYTQTDGAYYNALKFYYQANQLGILDPDSSAQNWNQMVAKFKDGALLFNWASWSSGDQYNSLANGNATPTYRLRACSS